MTLAATPTRPCPVPAPRKGTRRTTGTGAPLCPPGNTSDPPPPPKLTNPDRRGQPGRGCQGTRVGRTLESRKPNYNSLCFIFQRPWVVFFIISQCRRGVCQGVTVPPGTPGPAPGDGSEHDLEGGDMPDGLRAVPVRPVGPGPLPDPVPGVGAPLREPGGCGHTVAEVWSRGRGR